MTTFTVQFEELAVAVPPCITRELRESQSNCRDRGPFWQGGTGVPPVIPAQDAHAKIKQHHYGGV
jgi:hypothetical protein